MPPGVQSICTKESNLCHNTSSTADPWYDVVIFHCHTTNVKAGIAGANRRRLAGVTLDSRGEERAWPFPSAKELLQLVGTLQEAARLAQKR